MLKSCRYCGRIHDSKFDCGRKPKPRYRKETTDKDKFRWKAAWQHKREDIRERDNNLCQICIRGLYPYGEDRFNYKKLSVHHCIPIEEDYGRRLDDDNLLTTCDTHHEMAEAGKIPREIIRGIIEEQQDKTPPGGVPVEII